MVIYEFERVECSAGSYSLFGGVGLAMEGYQDIIHRRGREGWRFAGCIPATQRAGGFIDRIDLVFERTEE